MSQFAELTLVDARQAQGGRRACAESPRGSEGFKSSLRQQFRSHGVVAILSHCPCDDASSILAGSANFGVRDGDLECRPAVWQAAKNAEAAAKVEEALDEDARARADRRVSQLRDRSDEGADEGV